MNGPHKHIVFSFGLIALLSALVYANSLFGDFVCDDRPMILENEKLGSAKYIPQYFAKGLWDMSSMGVRDDFLYRPLFVLYLFLNYQLWGANPFGFHLSDLVLHIANSALVFVLARKYLRTDDHVIPLAGAIIFAVHPVHVECVSWISGSPDLVITLFFVSSFLFYLRYRETGKTSSLVLSFIAYALSLFSKEVAIVFPFIILAYEYLLEKRIRKTNILIFFFISMCYLFVRFTVLGKTLGTIQFSVQGMKYLAEFMAGYIKLLFVPWPLGFYFSAKDIDIIGAGGLVFSFAAVILMAAFVMKQRKALFPFLWALMTLAPPLLLAFYTRPVFAERYLYLPSVGFVVAFAVYFEKKIKQYPRMTLLFLSALALSFSIITVRASFDWKNDEVFYSKAIRSNPHYPGAYLGLAQFYERTGKPEKALSVYSKSINHIPEDQMGDIYEEMALIYGQKGDTDNSLFYYQKVLKYNRRKLSVLIGMGNNYFLRKDFDAALHYYQEAFLFDQKNYEACYNLSLTYKSKGDRHMESYYSSLCSHIRRNASNAN